MKQTKLRFYSVNFIQTGNNINERSFRSFIEDKPWPKIDFTPSTLRVANSSQDYNEFVAWVTAETGISANDLCVEEVTKNSANHSAHREAIERYYKITL